MKVSDIQGQVDFAIITMRDDELSAVLKRFPADYIAEGEREYNISVVPYSNSEQYLVAVTRCPQGNNQSQAIASDIIRDLDPQWLVLVGIAGAVPESEFTLGDVIIARKLADFTVGAATYPNKQEWAMVGGWMAESVGRIVDNLLARPELEGWNTEESIGIKRPPVDLKEENFIGSDQWKEKVQKRLEHHFGSESQLRSPLFTTATIASSGDLIKDSNLVEQWLNTARDLKAVEMELPGVYTAARTRYKEYPVLAIRGISDIVGFQRDPGWTKYACESAAAFANAFIKQRKPIEPRKKNHRQKSIPQTPWESMVKILDSNGNTVGSGFMIHRDGYFITCHQVIYNLDSIKVKYQEEEYSATWYEEFSNPEVDIAILKIDVENAKPIPLDKVRNQSVFATIYGFSNNTTNKLFKKDYKLKALNDEEIIPTISCFNQSQIFNFGNSWNRLPGINSEFKAYIINDSLIKEITGGLVLNKDSKAIGIVQPLDSEKSSIIAWVNIDSELKTLGLNFEAQSTELIGINKIENEGYEDDGCGANSVFSPPEPEYEKLLGRNNELETIIDKLTNSRITKLCGVFGFAGIGKTALVQEIIKHFDKSTYFSKVLWLSASPDANNSRTMTFESVINNIAQQLNRPDISKLEGVEKLDKTKKLLEENLILLVLDNMETSQESQDQIVSKLLPLLGSSKTLLTSRHRLSDSDNTQIYSKNLIGLRKEAALRLIRDTARQKQLPQEILNAQDDYFEEVIHTIGGTEFGYIPMALKFVTGQLEIFDSKIIADRLRRVDLFDKDGKISMKPDKYQQFWNEIFISSSDLLEEIDEKVLVGINCFQPEVGSSFDLIQETIRFDLRELMNSILKVWKLSFLERRIIKQDNMNIQYKYYQHILSHSYVKEIAPIWEESWNHE